jgi:hypothetical protein
MFYECSRVIDKRCQKKPRLIPLDVRTALEVQKEQETTDQIMNKLFENPKFRNAVEQALRVLK